jgi:hypothetical protein
MFQDFLNVPAYVCEEFNVDTDSDRDALVGLASTITNVEGEFMEGRNNLFD